MTDLKLYANQHGISVDTVRRRVKDGVLKSVRHNNKIYIVEDGEQSEKPTGAKLKEIKTAAEIKLIQQRLRETEDSIREDERKKFVEKIYNALKGIPESYRLAKLTGEQYEVINAAYDNAIKKLMGL